MHTEEHSRYSTNGTMVDSLQSVGFLEEPSKSCTTGIGDLFNRRTCQLTYVGKVVVELLSEKDSR